jgi:hypothetical protein
MIIELGNKTMYVNLEAVKGYTYDELSKVYKGDTLRKIAKAAGVKKEVEKKRISKVIVED